MRAIANKSLSCVICLSLTFGLLLGALAVPKRAHAFLPVVGGAAAAVGLSEVAEIGVFAALLAACGFSLANAVGANPDVPIADWSDGQLTDAQRKLQSASEYSEWLELTYFLNNAPDPPTEPPNDNGNGKKQPKKEDATSDLDYMIAMMGVNGAIALTGGFVDGVSGLVKWATAPESEGGGGFLGAGSFPSTVVSPSDSSIIFSVGNPDISDIGKSYVPDGYEVVSFNTWYDHAGYHASIEALPSTASFSGSINWLQGNPTRVYLSQNELVFTSYYNGSDRRDSSNYIGVYSQNASSTTRSVISPKVAQVINSEFTSVGGEILHAIQNGNESIVSALNQMATDQAAAVATLQQLYSNDTSTSSAGTPQYMTVQAPYYVQSGQVDPQTGQYTANIVANDYNHGTISQYLDAVATNTSSPQPGNTGYSPGDYQGNSSSDVPPWQPLLDIHLDRVWPFSLIGDSYHTFDDVFSMDGGQEWDWHITVPLSSWNIALGGAAVFDDYDLDLSMWRDLFAYLAPWFLLFVFLALLDMARRLWLRWNSSGDGD